MTTDTARKGPITPFFDFKRLKSAHLLENVGIFGDPVGKSAR
jgi:hypothetical protein